MQQKKSPIFSIGVTKQWFDVEYANQVIKMEDPSLMASFNNIINLPWGIIFGADFTFQGKGHSDNMYSNRNCFICNVSLQKSFLNDALTVEMRGSDLFHERINDLTMYMNRLQVDTKTYSDSREFVLTLRYKFNMTPSKYKGTGAGAEQKQRF